MKIFFAASTSQLKKYINIYKLICDIIVDSGHELTRDWLSDAQEVINKGIEIDYEEMYEDIIASILYADIGIIEGTVKGLSTGHQMTVALQKGKPILFIHQDTGDDKFPFIVKGVHSELFTDIIYDDFKEIPGIISKYLEVHKKGKRIRFNLVLSPSEEQYIEWASFMYKKTKTEIIRELINARIGSDLNYKRSKVQKR